MKHRLLIVLCLLLFLVPATCRSQEVKVFLPQQPATTAVIVCPGGSYCWLSKRWEGSEVAKWLNTKGLAAYVLHYPTAGWAAFAFHTRWIVRGHQYPDALNELTTVMSQLRGRYKQVGLMGFSAGGHLVLNAAESLPDSLVPDFVAACYPVVTFSAPCVHHRSRRGLLGERGWRNKTLCDSLSVELHADRIRCPIFLMNCLDDPIVDHHNAELMDSALTAAHKPHLFVQYSTGGHGFGVTASKTSSEAANWPDRFWAWLKQL